ncbi:MAG TPA: hypothetical protein VNY33_02555 [Gaiellaceae bacterium]|nr:hypothetical protein [Gaiellaceae bacterium]
MTHKYRLATVAALVVAATAAAAAYAGGNPLSLGLASQTQQPTYQGYYDGHKDGFVLTDVSSKSQAAALHINYSAALAKAPAVPEYFIKGSAAAGQITVFGSEPGKPDYNPLWDEQFVTWKAGVKPVLLVKDDQIKALAKSGKLTLRDSNIVLNAPILTVGK